MPKKTKTESKPSESPLIWTKVGELEVAYAEKIDRVFLRGRVESFGMRMLTADLNGVEPFASYVAATTVYGLDRATLRTLSALFPKKAKRG